MAIATETQSSAAAALQPSFSGIHHCSIIVTDLARADHFYREVLGLKPIHKPRTFDFTVLWYQLGDQHVHLIPSSEADAVSPRHMALHVSDARATRRYFKRLGIACRETTPIPGADRFFVSDPDGNLIECIQWLRPYDPEENAPPRDAIP
ncbi:MAG: VOC family protein [Planctomycetes bacterium]|nr:VOC family protein [Planctomycetota bacterium]